MILPFFFFTGTFYACGTVSRRLCKAQRLWFIKEARGRWDERPRCFLKDPLKGFREGQLALIPPSRSSKLSLIGVRSRYEQSLTLNTA